MNLLYPPCYPVCSCEPWQEGAVLQPWAFWTSLSYLLSAWSVWKRNPSVAKSWVSAVLMVTLASLLAHASFDVWSLAFDEAAGVFVLLPFDLWVPLVVGAFAVSAHLAVKKKGTRIFRDREFIGAMVVYGVAFLMFHFDRHTLLCDTEWIPFGHLVWHLGSAVTTYLLGDWWFRDHRVMESP